MKPCILLDGAFDPLHAGHIHYITSAKLAFPEYRLVVSVCSDDDIRAKGREPLLTQSARGSILQALRAVDSVYLKTIPTEQVIASLKPAAYIKGKDWGNRLPDEQLAACSLYGVQIVYLNTVLDSSTDRLRQWAAKEDAEYLYRLECRAQSQQPAAPWQPVTDYSFEARKAIEGPHPQIILDAFQPRRILDVGCGPGHLVRMLGDLGAEAEGMDVTGGDYKEDITDPMLREMIGWNSSWDLVTCREVLEHIPIRKIAQAVANLCQLSSRFIYVTTRFAKAPKSLLDADTSDDLDPTHITMLNQDFLRSLFVVNGGKRRRDLESKLDHMGKGRVLVYEV